MSSNNCLCFFTITSKIKPQTIIRIDITAKNPENIRVGILGTNPVLKYSAKTGMAKITDTIKNIAAIILKNICAYIP